jgi:hypothetical protein
LHVPGSRFQVSGSRFQVSGSGTGRIDGFRGSTHRESRRQTMALSLNGEPEI